MKDILWISLIGAGLVFTGLFILWLLMDLLVYATSPKTKKSKEDTLESSSDFKIESDLQCKQKAAAAAIAVSIALRNTSFLSTRFKNNQGLSAWQLTHRNQQIHNRVDSPFKNRNRK